MLKCRVKRHLILYAGHSAITERLIFEWFLFPSSVIKTIMSLVMDLAPSTLSVPCSFSPTCMLSPALSPAWDAAPSKAPSALIQVSRFPCQPLKAGGKNPRGIQLCKRKEIWECVHALKSCPLPVAFLGPGLHPCGAEAHRSTELFLTCRCCNLNSDSDFSCFLEVVCDPLLDYNVWSTLQPINSSGKVDPEKEVIIVATRVGTSWSCFVEHGIGFWKDVGFQSHRNILLWHSFISSHVPNLLDLTGYCVSASTSLLVGGFT